MKIETVISGDHARRVAILEDFKDRFKAFKLLREQKIDCIYFILLDSQRLHLLKKLRKNNVSLSTWLFSGTTKRKQWHNNLPYRHGHHICLYRPVLLSYFVVMLSVKTEEARQILIANNLSWLEIPAFCDHSLGRV